jgi:DNA invertase Pin-like site-specific DNA recombinase
VAAFDRLARSTRHFLNLIDELESLQIEFISRRENIDTSTSMGRWFVTIISSIAELELDLIRERVRAGMRRAKLEGRQIGRARLDVDREQIINDRRSGRSLTAVLPFLVAARLRVRRRATPSVQDDRHAPSG